jgi:hypothetical protein
VKKRVLIALGLTLLIVLAAMATQSRLFLSESSPEVASAVGTTPLSASKAEAPRASVEAMTGEVFRRDARGSWVPVRVGDELHPNTFVKTSTNATARLALGEVAVVDVAEETEIAVAEVSDTLSRVRLEDGRIASVVEETQGFRLRVEVKDSDVRAETRQGVFYVMRRGGGIVSVASRQGTTTVSSRGEEVSVAAGEQTVVEPGQAPVVPMKIPASLLLKLGRVPERLRTREATITGSTSPGAVVSLNGTVTTADGAGNFEQKVPLDEGANVVKVEVQDAFGRRHTEELPKIEVDTRPPKVEGKVKW